MLLTLGIIGVVAAITIPNLVQNSQNRELVSGLKKTYNTLTNGFKQSEVLLGKTTDIPYLTEREISGTTDREKYISYLTYDIKTMDNCEYDICLPDGQTITVGEIDTSCTTQASGSAWQLKHTCAILQVDVNGRKNPNKDAKDRYELAMTRYGIYPLGDKTDCSGLDCSAYTLANNKIYDGAITEREITIADCSSNQTLVNGTCANLSCLSGQKADNHQCVADLTNCSSKTGNTCDTCASGYQRINGGCIRPDFCDSTTGDCKIYGREIYDAGNFLISNGIDVKFYDDAQKTCSAKGMRMPTRSELQEACQKGLVEPTNIAWTGEQDSSGNQYLLVARTCTIRALPKNTTEYNPDGLAIICVANKNLD